MNIKKIKNILIEDKKIISSTVIFFVLASIVYCYFIATPYYKSQSNFYQKKTSNSLSNVNSSLVGKMFERQLGLGGNDRSFNIHIPELIYESDIILDYIIKHKFNTSVSKESIMLSEFWGFDEIQDDEERIFLLKEKLRKLINIKIKEESELVMMSIETEDRILSADIMTLLIQKIKDFISDSTSSHYRELKEDIHHKVQKKFEDFNNASAILGAHMINHPTVGMPPDIQLERMELENEFKLKHELYVGKRLEFEKAENLEKDNTETILIIKPPSIPVNQSWPKNLLIISLSFISSLFGIIYLLVLRRKFG